MKGVKKKYLTPYYYSDMITKVVWKIGVSMEKIVEQGILYDFYGELLTEHQRQIYEDAIFNDMSLSELADAYGISRQGIHDLLKRCDKMLLSYESKLHLVERFDKIKGKIRQINETEDMKTVQKLSAEILEEL